MAKLPAFPTITITCPACGIDTVTPLFGVESAIAVVCECGKVTLHIVVKESDEKVSRK
jgi:hypothetical protein